MKRKMLSGLMATLILATGTTSCNEDSNFEYNTSNECLITSMTMGVLKREMHTLNSKGEDSTFYVSVTGALYPFSIDQDKQRIYNLDSLPVGTDVSKVVLTSLNSIGAYSIRSLHTGNDTIFTLSDSTNFTVPRIITVHATDGVSKREYQVTINVHREIGDSMVWRQVSKTTADFADLTNMRSISVGDQLYLFGKKDTITEVHCTDTNNFHEGQTVKWMSAIPSTSICPQSVVRFLGQFYAVNAQQNIFNSTDGINWTPVATEFTPSTLVLGSKHFLVALKDGQFYSSADAITWTLNTSDEPQYLPEQWATGTCIPSTIDKNFVTWLVVGNHNGNNVVWKREIDLSGNEEFPWLYLSDTPSSEFNIPNYQQISLATYDGATLLAGLTPEGNMAPLLLSRDNGRTWKKDVIRTPEVHAQKSLAVNVDDRHFVWMFCGQTGEVWRGRINRLGWEDIPGVFEKEQLSNGEK